MRKGQRGKSRCTSFNPNFIWCRRRARIVLNLLWPYIAIIAANSARRTLLPAIPTWAVGSTRRALSASRRHRSSFGHLGDNHRAERIGAFSRSDRDGPYALW
jgi:hypothetical protein